jgi:SAM-dependent methyltransferase
MKHSNFKCGTFFGGRSVMGTRGSDWHACSLPGGSLWREHSDVVNASWITARLSGTARYILKTDLFDEAVGSGLYPYLTRSTGSMIGIDIAPSAASAARSRYPALVAIGADVRHLPFADDVFDAIVSNSTLDHFSTLDVVAEALRELHRVLRSGGALLLTMDNRANPAVALRNALPLRILTGLGIVPYRLGATCGPWRLKKLLSEAGFTVQETSAILHCPRIFAIARASRIERYGSAAARCRFLELLNGWERLGCWPTNYLTGYYVAVSAVKL